MFNLIRRDVILQKRQLLFLIPIIVFFVYMDKHHPAFIFIIASVFIPFNTYAYDEKTETNILLNSLPYTRREIIASRYLGAILYTVLSVGLASLALWIFNRPFAIADIAIGVGLFLLFAALTFPLFYILKPGYIFTAVLIGFLVLAAAGPPIVSYLAKHLTAITDFIVSLSVPVLYTGGALAVLAVYALSWGVTTAIYQRKAF